MKAYAIWRKNGGLWLRGICESRSECVYAWTGGIYRSENCKAWKKAKRIGVSIVRVRIELDTPK